jgi:hypothetical protein
MRKRQDIVKDGTRKDILELEVLLDIRDLLKKQIPKRKYTKRVKKTK